VFARDRAGQFVETFKRVVGDVKVEGRDVHFVRIDHSVVGEVAQCPYVWRRFVKIVHTFNKKRACVAVLTVELPKSK
jgi:hypothetical protein